VWSMVLITALGSWAKHREGDPKGGVYGADYRAEQLGETAPPSPSSHTMSIIKVFGLPAYKHKVIGLCPSTGGGLRCD
jgi:hypothetical protein